MSVILGEEETRYAPQDWTHIGAAIQIHDVEPVDRFTLLDLIHGTLELHSFFLQREVEWEWVRAEVTALLQEVGELYIQSYPEEGLVRLARSSRQARRQPPGTVLGEIRIEPGAPRFVASSGL